MHRQQSHLAAKYHQHKQRFGGFSYAGNLNYRPLASILSLISEHGRDLYSGHFPNFCPSRKNREEFEGGLHEKKEGKRGEKKKKEKRDKTHVKIPV